MGLIFFVNWASLQATFNALFLVNNFVTILGPTS